MSAYARLAADLILAFGGSFIAFMFVSAMLCLMLSIALVVELARVLIELAPGDTRSVRRKVQLRRQSRAGTFSHRREGAGANVAETLYKCKIRESLRRTLAQVVSIRNIIRFCQNFLSFSRPCQLFSPPILLLHISFVPPRHLSSFSCWPLLRPSLDTHSTCFPRLIILMSSSPELQHLEEDQRGHHLEPGAFFAA